MFGTGAVGGLTLAEDGGVLNNLRIVKEGRVDSDITIDFEVFGIGSSQATRGMYCSGAIASLIPARW